jgi:alpha-beta hydrolase superfamily lysophospholipase
MIATESWFETHNDIKLFLRKWKPEAPARAIIHILHGMVEHGGRYTESARVLTDAGFEVWCADLRGHGKTTDLEENDAASGGLAGHCADKDGIAKVLNDVNKINEKIRQEYPALPLFLLGHSWGSFLAQTYIESFKTNLSGCILSGTRGPGGLDIKAGILLARIVASVRGIRERSMFLYKVAFSSYNKFFSPNRTDFDWISRSEASVDNYIADPYCGGSNRSDGMPTVGFYRDMLVMIKNMHKRGNLDKIRRALPIYILGGSKDPVGGMGENITALVDKYNKIRIKDLEFVLYPDARHECFNEINRDEVFANLIKWLERHI